MLCKLFIEGEGAHQNVLLTTDPQLPFALAPIILEIN